MREVLISDMSATKSFEQNVASHEKFYKSSEDVVVTGVFKRNVSCP